MRILAFVLMSPGMSLLHTLIQNQKTNIRDETTGKAVYFFMKTGKEKILRFCKFYENSTSIDFDLNKDTPEEFALELYIETLAKRVTNGEGPFCQ